ncbi:hypothetical protein Cgig2_021217 [Carnegiea gigantea]|uniref:Uncharacterized protein n=1 Tax=Carnegiea gigantea TaxID=171969 RepID=A0A9Q1KX84_9CARY|nr:hypothetical protein Cgig2_021217 [Carnegiea gigantea]
MIVSDAIHAHSRRDKAPMTDAPVASKVQDALESSWANPRSVRQRLPEREAYVTVHALKNFMTTMTDTILQHLTEQVKKTIEVVSSIRSLPAFDYVPTAECEPSHMHALIDNEVREIVRPERIGRSHKRNDDRSTRGRHPAGHPSTTGPPGGLRGTRELCGCIHTLCNLLLAHGLGHPMLRKPQPITATPKPHNAQKYYEFYEQNGHTTVECRELKKAIRR